MTIRTAAEQARPETHRAHVWRNGFQLQTTVPVFDPWETAAAYNIEKRMKLRAKRKTQ